MTEQYDAHPERRKGIPDADNCIKRFGQETYLEVMYNNGIDDSLNAETIANAQRRQGSWRNNF
jgi:hypothetical protein